MITGNIRTQISEPSSNKTEKRNSSKHQTVLEKSLHELVTIQMEDEVKNLLVTINLVINSRDTKAMVRHLWKAVELHEQYYNKILNGHGARARLLWPTPHTFIRGGGVIIKILKKKYIYVHIHTHTLIYRRHNQLREEQKLENYTSLLQHFQSHKSLQGCRMTISNT
jgi:hypothetical protein